MRQTRILQYVHPDDWKGEEVKGVSVPPLRDGSLSSVRLVGLVLDRHWEDKHGPKRVPEGVYASTAERGGRMYFPEHDGGRSFPGPEYEDDAFMHEHPLTPIDELQTPWASAYGHAPGEGYGMNFCLVSPMKVKPDDVRLLIGRFETYRAERLFDHLPPGAPPQVRDFLVWLCRPGWLGRHVDENLRAQWLTYGAPCVLWCCSPAEADALCYAIGRLLGEELIASFAQQKGPERRNLHIADPRKLIANHLEAVTAVGDPGRYLAAAAFKRMGGVDCAYFQIALARKGGSMIMDPKAPMETVVEELGLTDDDLRQLAEAEKMLGL